MALAELLFRSAAFFRMLGGWQFWVDLGVTVGLSAIGLVCLFLQVPVLGEAPVVLAGPVVGLILALKHRPRRDR